MTAHDLKAEATRALQLAESIKPLLAGIGPGLQGAALAELVATWIAGYRVEGNDRATAALREAMLLSWLDALRRLVAIGVDESEMHR